MLSGAVDKMKEDRRCNGAEKSTQHDVLRKAALPSFSLACSSFWDFSPPQATALR
jgi:hypothetical protein